jgi:MFS family permease
MPQAETAKPQPRKFYGWWIAFASFFTFGISVGLPYYNIPFFYDYFQSEFHWERSSVTLGFPLAALLTLWVGPLIIPRFPPRRLILVGTACTGFAFFGFSRMNGDLRIYFACWVLYAIGYFLSGPIPHQILISHWFRKKRGMAMGIVYVGVGLLAAVGSRLVAPVTERFGFRVALASIGAAMVLAWPLALFVMRDKPSDMGQVADGALAADAEVSRPPLPYAHLLRSGPFWLLLIGSLCSIGSIGAINAHMKFVFHDAGFTQQKQLNATWSLAAIIISVVSIAGRLSIGHLSDLFSKKRVMTLTYFVVAASIPLLLTVAPPSEPYLFSVVFGFAMGADYMLIPLMAAEQFGVNSLSRAMAIILPVNTIGQTWCPQLVSVLREHSGSYLWPMTFVFAVAVLGAFSIAALPYHRSIDSRDTVPLAGTPANADGT